jgi:hypothetical protein
MRTWNGPRISISRKPMKISAFLLFFVLLFTQYSQAINLGDSPDGNWSIQSTAQDAIAIFNSAGRPVTILDRGINASRRFRAKWSGDSKSVVLLDQAPLGSGIIAAWFDGSRWHPTVEPDTDIDQAEALAESQGIHGEVKAEERGLENWISPDSIQLHGVLRYLGGKEFPYSYTLQIIPGSYPVNRGGFETGGLKASNFQAVAD